MSETAEPVAPLHERLAAAMADDPANAGEAAWLRELARARSDDLPGYLRAREVLRAYGVLQTVEGALPSAPRKHAPEYFPSPENPRQVVAKRLREARTAKRLSFRQLAARCAARPGTVWRWETGREGLSITRLFRVAAALGVAPSALVSTEPIR